MAGINLQTGDHSDRFLPETALVPAALAGGSSNPPKFGTLIPNRIFVGGIPSNTTEQELKSFFSSFGQVKDVKIISDRLGVSKGSYGFVTFESQEMAEKIIKNESETLIFKDRKLNIGHAIRKQQIFPRPDLPTTLFFAGGAMPYGFQNGMAVFSLPSQDYQMLAQTATPYATMMLPQPSGAALYLPSSLHSATSAGTSPYAHLSHHQVAAAALQQQQQYQSASVASGITPVAAATGGGGGHLPSVAVNGGNLGVQSNSTAAVMAAAAAAMAAAVQWPQTVANNSPSHPQLTSSTSNAMTQTVGGPQTVVPNASLTPQQAAAMAAAVAAQQTTWRWSPTAQQPAQTSAHATSCSAHGSTSGVITSTSSVPVASTTSTPTTTNQVLHHHQQVSDPNLFPLQPALTTFPATIRLTQPSVLAALAASALQQTGLNMLGPGCNGLIEASTAAALAALASTSMNHLNLISPEFLCSPDFPICHENLKETNCLSNNGVGSSDTPTQPSKKPKYDDDSPLKPDVDSTLNL
ncbi:unnamed protein product [Dicrocoelium dendriticum]|nr:unnamed protein product [Dicrocoelium dendriticum]